jgi:hypothetical protein
MIIIDVLDEIGAVFGSEILGGFLGFRISRTRIRTHRFGSCRAATRFSASVSSCFWHVSVFVLFCFVYFLKKF